MLHQRLAQWRLFVYEFLLNFRRIPRARNPLVQTRSESNVGRITGHFVVEWIAKIMHVICFINPFDLSSPGYQRLTLALPKSSRRYRGRTGEQGMRRGDTRKEREEEGERESRTERIAYRDGKKRERKIGDRTAARLRGLRQGDVTPYVRHYANV